MLHLLELLVEYVQYFQLNRANIPYWPIFG
jgi:hypothetical protein